MRRMEGERREMGKGKEKSGGEQKRW